MAAEFIVPPIIEEVIAQFDGTNSPLTEHDVKQALVAARGVLASPSEAENAGAWAEVLAFALVPNQGQPSPWKTYFGPMGSRVENGGSTIYAPDIAGTPSEVILHWIQRAKTLKHPVLKARYADLAWDMSRAIAKINPDIEMAKVAIDAYLAALSDNFLRDAYERFHTAIRALNLAVMIRDNTKVELAKNALLALHRDAMTTEQGLWWFAVDRLLDDKGVVIDAERDQLIADLEAIVAKRSNTLDAAAFDPHAAESAAGRLVKHYNKCGKSDDARRLHEIMGRTFEHFASLGNAMLASAHLQTAVNAYRDAGLPKESKRARIAMEEKIAQSHDEATAITFETTISKEDMETFLAGIVTSDLGSTFTQIAAWFLQSRSELEKHVANLKEQAPLMAMIGQTIIGDNHVAAKIGSTEDDPFGRLIRQAAQEMPQSDIWLVNALRKTIEVHSAMAGHFAGWAARSGLFDDLTLMMEGVRAWYDQDFVKAVHVLVPQVEKGLRGIVSKLGKPITKRHPTIPGVSVVIGMGDILYSDEIRNTLGSDIILHFLTLYSDPRGLNLRNEVAHGLIRPNEIYLGIASRIIHTLLIFGIWESLSMARRDQETSNSNTAVPS